MTLAPELMGDSTAMVALRETLERLLLAIRAAKRPPSVLIQGETGTGKGLVAHVLWARGPRRRGPFVPVNCSTIPTSLSTAELFGTERGAYTDAKAGRPGYFEQASGGILFLDEIGLLPRPIQGEILTVLEEPTIRRLAATAPRTVDVWVIAATNENLPEAVRRGRFREDLHQRLARVTIRMPPLRDREEDILPLARSFLARACADYGLPPKQLAASAERALCEHRWPGNVRELINLIEQAALLSPGEEIARDLLQFTTVTPADSSATPPERPVRRSPPAPEAIRAALDACGGKLATAARVLGLPRTTLRELIQRHGITREAPAVGRAVPGADVAPPEAAATVPATTEAFRWESRWIAALRISSAGTAGPPRSRTEAPLALFTDKIAALHGRVASVGPLDCVGIFGLVPMEDAAGRAGQAALTVLKAIERDHHLAGDSVPPRIAIHVRECLIARGPHVLDVSASDAAVIVTTLAALAERAAPGTIVASDEAAAFLRRSFVLAGERRDGADTADVYRLVAPRRFSVPEATSSSPRFVGREQEMSVLYDRFDRAAAGEAQIVVVTGEPGVGKSRLVGEFRHLLGADRVRWLEGRCHPQLATPYFAVRDLLQSFFHLHGGESPSVARAKMHDVIRSVGLPPHDAVATLGELLGLGPPADPVPTPSPEATWMRIVNAVSEVVAAAARHRPTVILVEDVHWIDHASRECLAAVIDRVASARSRVMIVTTSRDSTCPGWLARAEVAVVNVGPLSEQASRTIVRDLPAGGPLPDAVVELIVKHADGIPLFVEELTHVAAADPGVLAGDVVPKTVAEVVAARVDRLPRAEKEVVQAASVLGVEADVPTLRAMLGDVHGAVLDAAAAALQRVELILEQPPAPRRAFTFRHALTRNAVYASLLDAERESLHGAAAAAILRCQPEAAERTPEILAAHLTRAGRGRLDDAIDAWTKAGRRALACAAHRAATEHLDTALELLGALPDSAERALRELQLRSVLGYALAWSKGYGAPEFADTLARARALCAQAGAAVAWLFPVLFGVWQGYEIRAEHGEALGLATQLRSMAAEADDRGQRCEAHVALGVSRYYLSDLTGAADALREALALYDPQAHGGHVVQYGQDPAVLAGGFLGVCLVHLGALDDAVDRAQQTLRHARDLAHPFNVALALHLGCLVHQQRGDVELVAAYAREELGIARTHGFPLWRAGGLYFTGWCAVRSGEPTEGLVLMEQGVAAHEATGARLGRGSYLADLALAYAEAGRTGDALATIDASLAFARDTDETSFAAEIHRIRGRVLLACDRANRRAAEVEILTALRLARRRQQRLLGLRAAVDLARLAEAEGRTGDAAVALAEMCGQFTQGLDVPDVQRARRLLAELEDGSAT